MRALYGLALIVLGSISRTFAARDPSSPDVTCSPVPALDLQTKEQALPKHTVTYFEYLPAKLHYFDNSNTIVYLDEIAGDIYISETEGETWRLADGIPKGSAHLFIEHPFSDHMAFVLTRGTTHYRTTDRGSTWQIFEVPLVPSIGNAAPLSFHADIQKSGYILYQGDNCEAQNPFLCHQETYYTKEAFADEPRLLLSRTSNCLFAHSLKESLSDEHSNLLFCVQAFGDSHYVSLLRASIDFFITDSCIIDVREWPTNRIGVIAIAATSKFLVVAVQAAPDDTAAPVELYVTVDSNNWQRVYFPHSTHLGSAYTIVETIADSLAIDVQSESSRRLGSLFVSNSNGTYFVESLTDTHRSDNGFLDFMRHHSVQGISLVNHVHNAREVDGGDWNVRPELKTMITYDGGSSWRLIKGPFYDTGSNISKCEVDGIRNCSLHLHLSTSSGVFTPPTPPGFIIGVGSVSEYLMGYEESDAYLSRDAGATWTQVRRGAHNFAFGDHGNIIILVDDEKPTNHVRYSTDLMLNCFLLIGLLNYGYPVGNKRVAVIQLDFGSVQTRQCDDSDVEKWYAASSTKAECIMGQKKWFWRRKSGADCIIGNKFKGGGVDPEQCLCTGADYSCDYKYVRKRNKCMLEGQEPIPVHACDDDNQTYEAPSGYRLIPGNLCRQDGGARKDEPITENCTEAEPDEGEVAHQIFKFSSVIAGQPYYFRNSKAVMLLTWDYNAWQSDNEGHAWRQFHPGASVQAVHEHPYSDDRVYLLLDNKMYWYTTDGRKSWDTAISPFPTGRTASLVFHPENPDYIIWTSNGNCSFPGPDKSCYTGSALSLDHGQQWRTIETYVDRCVSVEKGVICASYHNKTGHQHGVDFWNPLELFIGWDWYDNKQKLFDHIVGFKGSKDYLFVAATDLDTFSLDLHVSFDGGAFVKARFPPEVRLGLGMQDFKTLSQPTPDATFLHVGISDEPGAGWGALLKSDAKGISYGLSLDYVDRNWYGRGYVDHVHMPGIYGVAMVNILTNPKEAVYTGKKKIQTRISHNDAGSWQSLRPPMRDSNGAWYDCGEDAECSLHLHSPRPRDETQESLQDSSISGLMLAVGNVGKFRGSYEESDMFLTRDAGLTWEEVHKGVYEWAFGDSGSILVIVDATRRTDHVQFTTDQDLHWRNYNFGVDLRVRSLTTAPGANSRRFLLIGDEPNFGHMSLVVHLNFAELTGKQCELDLNDGRNSDFEVWNPSEGRGGQCFLGGQTRYYRRKRSANCYMGDLAIPAPIVQSGCACTESDFECDYGYVRNGDGKLWVKNSGTKLRHIARYPSLGAEAGFTSIVEPNIIAVETGSELINSSFGHYSLLHWDSLRSSSTGITDDEQVAEGQYIFQTPKNRLIRDFERDLACYRHPLWRLRKRLEIPEESFLPAGITLSVQTESRCDSR